MPLPSPEDSFARVDLFLWQYGELPQPDEKRELNVAAGLKGMAEAIKKKDMKHFPSPMNVMVCLEYAAKLLEKHNINS